MVTNIIQGFWLWFHSFLRVAFHSTMSQPEKYIASSAAGQEVVSSARMHVAKQHSADNTPYFERLLQAQVLHEAFLVDAKKDFWLHVMVFDRVLTE
ncbi:MAG TPA: hypothetical protein DCQ17_03245 [Firmicutes bacterium]|nr:hypothetical protein [Bacillota bacterium]